MYPEARFLLNHDEQVSDALNCFMKVLSKSYNLWAVWWSVQHIDILFREKWENEDPYDCCGHLRTEEQDCLAMGEHISQTLSARQERCQVHPSTAATASAGAFNTSLWIIVPIKIMTRGAINSPVTFMQNTVTLCPLYPCADFPTCFCPFQRSLCS